MSVANESFRQDEFKTNCRRFVASMAALVRVCVCVCARVLFQLVSIYASPGTLTLSLNSPIKLGHVPNLPRNTLPSCPLTSNLTEGSWKTIVLSHGPSRGVQVVDTAQTFASGNDVHHQQEQDTRKMKRHKLRLLRFWFMTYLQMTSFKMALERDDLLL